MLARDLRAPGAEEPDEISDRGTADRVSQLYQNLREKARARGLAEAAMSKAAKTAVKMGIRPFLLPVLAVIGVVLAIAGLGLLLISMFSGPGVQVDAVLPQ